MSRTNPRIQSKNPAVKFISLSGETGLFNYYNKEKQVTIEFDYPISFIPLDVLSAIKGYSDKKKNGIYSNEVHDLNTEILKVQIFQHGVIAEGLYNEIKDKIKTLGAKFAACVYAMMINTYGEPEIVCFQLIGASLNPFIDKYSKMVKNGKFFEIGVDITGSTPAKKGSNSYFIPTFETTEVSKAQAILADKCDIELQEYFTEYKKGKAIPVESDEELHPAEEEHHEEIPGEETEEKESEPKNKEQLQQGEKIIRRGNIIDFGEYSATGVKGKNHGYKWEELPDTYIVYLLNNLTENHEGWKNAILEAGSRPSIIKDKDGIYAVKAEEKPAVEKIDNSAQIKESKVLLDKMVKDKTMSKGTRDLWIKELSDEKDQSIFTKLHLKIITASSISEAFVAGLIDMDTKNKYFKVLKQKLDELDNLALKKITTNCRKLIDDTNDTTL